MLSYKQSAEQADGFNWRAATYSFRSIPLRRSVEVNFYRLLCVRDVVPSPEGFPSFRHNLYQHSSKRRVGYVSDSFAVGLHIKFVLLVFHNLALFDVFQVNARVFYRRVLFASRDLNGHTRCGTWSLSLRLGKRRRAGGCHAGGENAQRTTQASKDKTRNVHVCLNHPPRKHRPWSSPSVPYFDAIPG